MFAIVDHVVLSRPTRLGFAKIVKDLAKNYEILVTLALDFWQARILARWINMWGAGSVCAVCCSA